MAHELDDMSVIQINAGDEKDASITLVYNAIPISTSIFASEQNTSCSSTEHPIKTRLIRILNETVLATDEEYDRRISEVLDIIPHVGGSCLSEGAPRVHHAPVARQDLQSLLCPKTLNFRLQTFNGKAKIFLTSKDEAVTVAGTPDPRPDALFQADDHVPRHPAADITIQDILVSGGGFVGRAQTNGNDMLCKANRSGLWNSALDRELAALQSIQSIQAATSTTIRTPSLYGYITHEQSNTVVGLLRPWIAASPRGKTLRDIDMTTVPPRIRQKWAEQIRETGAGLHGAGIIWGDGKPSNIIIDEEDSVHWIDFAGGWPVGWVDEELAETVEGDEQAAERIIQLLCV